MNLSQQLKTLADKVVYAELTMSEYYNIGCIKVRVSDHMSNDMDCDLAVFGSKDVSGKRYVYAVIPMVGTFKEVQWFSNAKAVVNFIIRFESIARLLIKSPTRNNNQRERAEFNAANKNECEANNTIDQNKEILSICNDSIEFNTWKTKLSALYTEKNGALIDVRAVNGDEDLMIMTSFGVFIRIPLEQVGSYSRNTQGVKLVTIKDGGKVQTCAVVDHEEEEEASETEEINENVDNSQN